MKEPFRAVPDKAAAPEPPASVAVMEKEPVEAKARKGRPRKIQELPAPAPVQRVRAKPGRPVRAARIAKPVNAARPAKAVRPVEPARLEAEKPETPERRIVVHEPEMPAGGEKVEVRIIPARRERPVETRQEHWHYEGAPWMVMDYYWKAQQDAMTSFYETWMSFQQMGMQIFFGMWQMR